MATNPLDRMIHEIFAFVLPVIDSRRYNGSLLKANKKVLLSGSNQFFHIRINPPIWLLYTHFNRVTLKKNKILGILWHRVGCFDGREKSGNDST